MVAIVNVYYTLTTTLFSTGGIDFTEVSMVRVVSAATTESCIDITVNDDSILEGIESFTVNLESAEDHSVQIGSISSALIMILDNDGT